MVEAFNPTYERTLPMDYSRKKHLVLLFFFWFALAEGIVVTSLAGAQITRFAGGFAIFPPGWTSPFRGAWVGPLPEANPTPYDALINEAGERYGLDPALIKGVIREESPYFDPNAVSPKGAMGLMQLMPGTARLLGVSNAFDPRENVMGGAAYLRMLLDRYGGNVTLALAAYNAGPARVDVTRAVPSIPETLGYVPRVLAYWRAYRNGEDVPVILRASAGRRGSYTGSAEIEVYGSVVTFPMGGSGL